MWHNKSINEVVTTFKSDIKTGLTSTEVTFRQKKYGLNYFPPKKKRSLILKFFDQFRNFLVIILLFATVISFIFGEYIDAFAISIIVTLNAVMGFLQEIQAEKTLESLKEKEIIYSLAVRSGKINKLPSRDIVPGDIIILEEGVIVPADGRIIESFALQADESVLTGESQIVFKKADVLDKKNIPLGDRVNMVYKDTRIIAGRGKMIATETGIDTETGKIAKYLEESEEEITPLSIELDFVAKTLTIVICTVALIILIINLIRDISFVQSLLTSISLAVAAIPEGLPAIVTIVLSLGVKKLAVKKSIVKELTAVETLGAVKMIVTDKTGTLTQNKINAVKVILPDGTCFRVTGEGYNTAGNFYDEKGSLINPEDFPNLTGLLKISAIASNATVKNNEVLGDTTEGALIVAAERANISTDRIKTENPKIYEIPFTSERKMMSVIVKNSKTREYYLYSKGAPEVILKKCLSQEQKNKMLITAQNFAKQGYRSLSVAYRKINQQELKSALKNDKIAEANLIYYGLVLMQDPLRPEIKEAINKAANAGIRTIMITGDHMETARTIAREAGIIKENAKILSDNEVSRLPMNKLREEIRKGVSCFARISPMGKLKIVEAIKSIPHTLVAVTGDGVNDAPALQAANIGIAMGKTGTDITRDVADLVITDDNYATIIDAIKEGRIIFANLVKFIRYLISCNLSEVLVVALAVLFQTPLPLMPIQILWINLITDGLPALALGLDPPEHDVMKNKPRDISVPILHKTRWAYMLLEGSIMGITVFLLFVFSLNKFSYFEAQTIAFTTLAFSQLVHAFNNRSTRKSLFEIGIFDNKYLVGATVFSVILQFLTVQSSTGNIFFQTKKLELSGWLIIITASLIPFFVVEIKKQLRFKVIP